MIQIDNRSRQAVLILRNLGELTQSGIDHGAFTSGRGLVKTASDAILAKPKGGRTYIRRDSAGRRRRHVASAPGETHANMTGTLRKSLGFKVNPNKLEFGYGVQSNDAPAYAETIEFGGGRVKPRPTLQRAMKSEARNFEANFAREIGKRLEGKGF